MDAPQGDLDKLTISQLESLIADRRNRESRRMLRHLSGRQPEPTEREAAHAATPQGLVGPQPRPSGGRGTSPLPTPTRIMPPLPQERSTSAAALFAPDRFHRTVLSAPVVPPRQRGPAWLRKSPVQKTLDVGLLMVEVGFVVLLLWVVGQWLITDAQVTADPDAQIMSIQPPIGGSTGITVTLTTVAASAEVKTPTPPPTATSTPSNTATPQPTATTTATPSPTATLPEDDDLAPDRSPAPPGVARGPGSGQESAVTSALASLAASVSMSDEQLSSDLATPTFTATPTATATPENTPTETPTITPSATPTSDAALDLPIELDIPKIKVDVRVRDVVLNMSADQATWEVADFMAGHHEGTANPGQQGNMVIAGHRDIRGSVFRNLDQLKAGDEIFVSSARGVFRYVVRTTLIVRPDEVSVMKTTPDYRLTLITCTPVKIASHRLIIVADLDPTYVTQRGQ